jgi:hypothetical protein
MASKFAANDDNMDALSERNAVHAQKIVAEDGRQSW